MLSFLFLGCAAAALAQEQPVVRQPDRDIGVATLDGRRRVQTAASRDWAAFSGFRFEDRQPASGITFKHQIVDDAGYHYKPVHYDHGNSVSVADVDGDGRQDIYFLTQLGSNELWRNLGDGRFENITAAAGVGVAERVSVASGFADVDRDGDPDLFVTTVKMGNLLLLNDGKGRFTDVSESWGVDYVGHSSGVVFFDYDRDGWIDLFVTNVGTYTSAEQGRGGAYVGLADAFKGHYMSERFERSLLYRNDSGKRFVDVTADVLVDDSWSGDASFEDVNGDGFPDLYVLNMQGDDHYYENQGGQRFVDRTEELFPKTPWGAMGIQFFDYDNDGRRDLVLTDMHSDMGKAQRPGEERSKSVVDDPEKEFLGHANNILGNALYHRLPEGGFEEVSDAMGTENYWPWGLSVGDVNADGWEDIFITASMNFPYRYGVNGMLLNDEGRKFVRAEFVLGIEPRRDGKTHTPWFELDCAGPDRERPLCEGQTGRITVEGTAGTRASVIFDLDDDGDLDIVTGEFGAEPQVLISNLSDVKDVNYLKVRLIGRASNRDGLGARVDVRAGSSSYTKVHDGKSGYLSQSLLPLYFGLGDAEKVDQIEVLWPSGTRQVLGPVEANRLLEITEEASEE